MNSNVEPVDHTWQTIKACLIAPWSIVPVTLLYLLLFNSGQISQYLQLALIINIFGVPIAYLITAFVGLPTHLLLKKIGIHKVYVYSALGGIFVPLIYLNNNWNAWVSIFSGHNLMLYLFMICGVIVATTFGYIVNSHRITTPKP